MIANVRQLIEVRGGGDSVLAAASYVEEFGFTPFDARHLVESDGGAIVSSDDADDGVAPRLPLEDGPDE